MNSIWASKIVSSSLSKPMIMPHQTSMPGVLDAVDLLEHRPARPDVLELLGLAQRRLVGALDADEDRDDVGLDHQLHQLGVVGQVDRRLGEEGQRVARARPARRSPRGGPSLIAFLLPIRLSSTMKTIRIFSAQIASSSAMIWRWS